jgi:hypothetical protein
MTTESSFSRSSKRPYCLIWHRRGAADSFRHFVVADSLMQAVERSRKEIRLALASNSVLWILDGRITNRAEKPNADRCPAKPEHRHSGDLYVWLVAAFVSIGLMLWLTWQHHTELVQRSDEVPAAIPDRTIPESVTPQIRVEKALVERSLAGVVFSTTTIDVRASRTGRFIARDLRVGERVVTGEVIGEYDLSLDPPPCQLQQPDAPLRCGSEDGNVQGDRLAHDNDTVTAPITGIIVTGVPENAIDVGNGTLLFQIAEESGLRVTISAHRLNLDLQQVCDVWKAGSFLSFGEIVRDSPGPANDSHLSLRLLDQFAAVAPGMDVDVRCALR